MLHQWIPPSFGNAVVAANQQTVFCKLSSRDTSLTPHTEWASLHSILPFERPKWKVKWKISTSALLQTTTASDSSKTAPSHTFSTLLQVPARSLTGGQENTSCMMHTQVPLRHAFVQGNVVSTNNTGPVVTNVVQIGNPIIQGNVDSTNNMGPFARNVGQTGPVRRLQFVQH